MPEAGVQTGGAEESAASQLTGTVEIDLVGISDLHAQLDVASSAPGVAVLAGAVDAFRAENPETLFISAGDNFDAPPTPQPGRGDSPTVDALNAMGLDASTIGNNDFVDGRPAPSLARATFAVVCANLYGQNTGQHPFPEYSAATVSGVRVGFIGAVTEAIPVYWSRSAGEQLAVRPMVPEVNRVAEQLSDGSEANGEADVLVLLVHEGPGVEGFRDPAADPTFGSILSGLSPQVDAVLAGHTHMPFARTTPVAGWPAGLARPVVQGGSYGQYLAHVSLTVDRATGSVVQNAAELVRVAGVFNPSPAVATLVADTSRG